MTDLLTNGMDNALMRDRSVKNNPRRQRATQARIGALTTRLLPVCLGVALLTGCSDRQPTVASSDLEMSVQLPVGGTDPGDHSRRRISIPVKQATSVRRHAPFTVQGANARLVSIEKHGPSPDRMRWGLNQLRTQLHPPSTSSLMPGETALVQVVQPPVQQVVPPAGQIPIEIIPTPIGVPDPVGKTPMKDGENPPNQTPPGPDELMAKNLADGTTKPRPKDVIPADPTMPNAVPDKEPQGMTPESFKNWPIPELTLFVTGQQNGYIEPCGCTGLDKQKGGIARRNTFIKQLKDKSWRILPIDSGNQVRRIGQQALIKLTASDNALRQMSYESIGFGPDDMRLPGTELLAIAAADDPATARYVSGNVVLFDPSFIPTYKVVERGGVKVGLTNILDPAAMKGPVGSDIEIKDPTDAARDALMAMNSAGARVRVVTFFGKEETASKIMQSVPGYDLIVVSGGYGEPTYKPVAIDNSATQLIVTGNKGMYAGLVGLYKDRPMKYARVALTHEFKDDREMRSLMGEYQKELERLGLEKLGLEPIPHGSGEKFVGAAACGKCHEDAFDIWEGSAHAHATASIVSPPDDRGDVPRHFDPECLSCHVTGWNPEGYYPYATGYVDLQASKHLHGNGCENCHGPGAGHAAAEEEGSGISDDVKAELRKSMQLPLAQAKAHCMKCHDLDNSPDFHQPDAFEDEYWPEVEH